ncbi:MAG: hypothetical protein KKB30_09070 [Proteobacteria bacterium]|nr:hypothetical protein [Pseudomonadota bacterium]MBU1714073.1 hypothetical protein [Pseudomonadota bacterium]
MDEIEKHEIITPNEEKLFSGLLLLNAKALGIVLGLLCGLGLFVATNWLVIKGGPKVGQNLQLLSQYFIGYRVSFIGSIIGFFYGFAVGTISGSFLGWLYNKISLLRE